MTPFPPKVSHLRDIEPKSEKIRPTKQKMGFPQKYPISDDCLPPKVSQTAKEFPPEVSHVQADDSQTGFGRLVGTLCDRLTNYPPKVSQSRNSGLGALEMSPKTAY